MAEWTPDLVLSIDLASEPFNIHNYPGVNKVFKRAGDIACFGLFVLLPVIGQRSRSRWARYFAPDRYAILSVLTMVVLRQITHTMGDLEMATVEAARDAGNAMRDTGSISKNLSEFRELFIYYLILMWFSDVVFFRRSPVEEADAK